MPDHSLTGFMIALWAFVSAVTIGAVLIAATIMAVIAIVRYVMDR